MGKKIVEKIEEEILSSPGAGESGFQNLFNTLFSSPDASVQKEIVNELLSTDNLAQKTELEQPMRWAALTIIKRYLKEHDMVKSAAIIHGFTQLSFRYLISKKRQSRREYLDALHSLPAPESPGEGGINK